MHACRTRHVLAPTILGEEKRPCPRNHVCCGSQAPAQPRGRLRRSNERSECLYISSLCCASRRRCLHLHFETTYLGLGAPLNVTWPVCPCPPHAASRSHAGLWPWGRPAQADQRNPTLQSFWSPSASADPPPPPPPTQPLGVLLVACGRLGPLSASAAGRRAGPPFALD
jgi:hypothetical protein